MGYLVAHTLAPFRRGAHDPTRRDDPDGSIWRAVLTPQGSATLQVLQQPDRVLAKAWGSGADWVLDSLPRLLGADDDPTSFNPRHPVLKRLVGKFPGLRIGATGLVMESLIPTIIEQKVTTREAHQSFRRLVLGYGTVAPGPGSKMGLWVQPDAERLRGISSWEWTRLSIGRARAGTLATVASRANTIESLGALTAEEFDKRVRSIEGIGPWTSAEARSRVFGDPDAVSFGDFHVSRNLGWVLEGEPVDDARLEEILMPYLGHRYRVQRLVELANLGMPRRGPRMPLPKHVPGL